MIPQIRIAQANELGRVLAAYRNWSYGRGIAPDDTTWIAEAEGELIGVVRIAPERSTLVLRGMRIAEPWQRRGIGSRMLNTIAGWLDGNECYCVPYSHLLDFYGQVGFVEITPSAAPDFLTARLAEYRRQALSVIIMKRLPPVGIF
jgi:GNAT superfamily N-acetyltransferase